MQELADSLTPRPDVSMVNYTTIVRASQSPMSALCLFSLSASLSFVVSLQQKQHNTSRVISSENSQVQSAGRQSLGSRGV
eukprot:13415414-Ditylum_brightwellii.AAC.1